MTLVDVVIVSYNSREHLRSSVEHLTRHADIHVIVVDNKSSDGSLATLAGLPVSTLALPDNRGFAAGCNAGWRSGDSPFVLLLNPDARIDPDSLDRLVSVLQTEERVGVVAPRIVDRDGALDFSQRRFPRLRSTYAQALFLHRLLPRATWTDEVMGNEVDYNRPGSPDWVSGACMLLRRSTLEQIGGLDEGFFMYCEDIDLCRRVSNSGYEVRFDPEANCVHVGGSSGPRSTLLPTLATSRVRYARKHRSTPAALLERLGVAFSAVTHAAVSRGGSASRAGHLHALVAALRTDRAPSPNG